MTITNAYVIQRGDFIKCKISMYNDNFIENSQYLFAGISNDNMAIIVDEKFITHGFKAEEFHNYFEPTKE